MSIHSSSEGNEATWLSFQTTLEEYIDPSYYDELLAPYEFAAGTDLDLLRAATTRCAIRRPVRSVLELGCGTGRATEVLRAIPTLESYTGVDLSGQMIDWCRRRYRDDPRMQFVQSDSLDHLARWADPIGPIEQFDLVVSLWSFSHSVHQGLRLKDGWAAARETLRRTITDVLASGGTFYLIHFDALSDEQRVLVRQWNRILPIFAPDQQSPSKQMMDELVAEFTGSGQATGGCRHHRGTPIRYPSLDRAMETFVNFHLEGFFNERPELPEVLRDVRTHLAAFELPDGSVEVAPGAFEYEITAVP